MFSDITPKYYKPKLWKRVLGKLGFKKYKVNYVYGVDWATGDDSYCECSGHYDADGVLNITSFKYVAPPRRQANLSSYDRYGNASTGILHYTTNHSFLRSVVYHKKEVGIEGTKEG